ncbi:TPA: hypothetical protein ACYHOP_000244 [Vibrio cholerae]|uniref:hypothetical protein n=1 Tax=Vibrio cholerae TaxID=666 RepID=UPI0011F11E89|nr:hypothetical protein [Vibrio cholerae]KAA1205871.1 hypothetical protein F0M20_05075 [Vibrio cholerae]MVB21190.1 hypothetical protein [Vibrio cholerae]MVB49194.1 hypothetical protein [Vibrio cholerae]HDZ3692796.1 hypothetical protein [Vibrio cholerae]
MKVVPMIFNTDMVKALMAGDKVVTRRQVKFSRGENWQLSIVDGKLCESLSNFKPMPTGIQFPCNIGDLIYVRETFAALGHNDYQQVSPRNIFDVHEFRYKASERDSIANCADWEVRGYHWRPSIHMPRTASRLTLKVTDVRIEKLQDITEDQCWKEGIEHIDGQFDIYQLSEMAKTFDGTFEDAKASFACLWDSIYKDWHQNPYVWVIEFEVIHQNVDQYLQSIKNAA